MLFTHNFHLSTRKLVKASEIAILLFSSIVLFMAGAPRFAHGTTSGFPAAHAELLGTALYDVNLEDPGTAFTGTATARPLTVGPNIQVNAPQSPFPAGLLGRSETTIAAGEGGTNLVAGWNDADGFLREPFTVPASIGGNPGLSGFAFSTDGGNTWTDGDTPPLFSASTPFFSGDVVTRGDPWMAVSNDGTDTFLYANLAVFKARDTTACAAECPIVDAGVSVHRGTFSGSSFSWNDGRILISPNAPRDFYDKEAITARGGIAIVSVTNFIGIATPGTNPDFCAVAGGFGQIEAWRSSDGGSTFQGPVIVSPDMTDTSTDPNCLTGVLQQGSDPAVGKDSNVVVTWERGPTFVGGATVSPVFESIMAGSSSNKGASFSAPVVIHTILAGRQRPPVGYNRSRYNDFPRIAIDRASGRVYVVFQDATVAGQGPIGGTATFCVGGFSANPFVDAPSQVGPSCPMATQRRVQYGGGADTDIYLSHSDDNGATWSTPTLINPTAGDGKIQFWPVVSIGSRGEVNVVYYQSQEINLAPIPAIPMRSDIECSIRTVGASSSNPGLVRRSFRSSMVDTYLAQSTNGGVSFGTPVKVSTVSSNWCKVASNIRPNFGDYIGATTVGPTTYAVWADDRSTVIVGGTPRNVANVLFATIRDPPRTGGSNGGTGFIT